LDADTVVNAVASLFAVRDERIRTRITGRQPVTLPRKVAIYGCHHYADMPQKAIASYFGFRHTGSVVQAINKRVMAGELKAKLDRLEVVFDVDVIK
jgi:chromosomal replication initiation ATPase DnaA